MRKTLMAALLGALVGCAGGTPFAPVTAEPDFAERVVGRGLAYPEGTVVLEPGGGISGALGEEPVTGRWSWENGLVCREVWIGPRTYPRACLTPEMAGERLRFAGGEDPLGAEAVLR